ncbi:MAG: hypothetical protein IPJ00_22565 [Saprospirales bacterium]|nr:hypothetical protein [Saprospirales bacterium]
MCHPQLRNLRSNHTTVLVSASMAGPRKYDLAGNFLGNFVEPGSGGLSGTEDMLFHPDGSVLVTGFANTAIKRYDGATGDYLPEILPAAILSTRPPRCHSARTADRHSMGTTQNKVVRFGLDGAFVDRFTDVGA